MKVLITGATGFLGKPTVEAALSRGHSVRAVVRPGGDASRYADWTSRGVELARVDLRSKDRLAEAVRGVDCVLHLAASKAGDMYAQYGGTVVSTENLLWAMEQAGVGSIVNISSFAVYDYIGMRSGSELTEDSPLAAEMPARDEYCHTKLVQENLVRECVARLSWRGVVLRPGVIYGADNWWTARLGAGHSERKWLRIGGRAMLPLTYVENCAEAIVLAAEKCGTVDAGRTLTLNVVDEQVSQAEYARQVIARLPVKPAVRTIPWPVMRFVAWGASTFNSIALKGRAKLPAILVPARLHARFKPLRYGTRRIREELGFTPKYQLSAALERTFAGPNGKGAG